MCRPARVMRTPFPNGCNFVIGSASQRPQGLSTPKVRMEVTAPIPIHSLM